MKKLKGIFRRQDGQVLPVALVLLALGAFLVVPVIILMTTNLNANLQVDTANLELYAADAGVEQVLWHLRYNTAFALPYDGGQTALPQFTINDKTIDAVLSKDVDELYKITSVATSLDGHRTTVECYIDTEADLSWLFDSAITSVGTVTIKPGTVVTGDVTCGTEDGITNQGTIVGDEVYDPDLEDDWPSADDLSEYYYEQVKNLTPYGSSLITVSGTEDNPTIIGPLYRNGDLLIKGDGWARLDGLVYVTGKLEVNANGGCQLGLNNNTMFSAYDNNCSGDAIYLSPHVTLFGSGCIIAVGNILFQPNLSPGDKLIGVDSTAASNGSASSGTFLLSRFQAVKSGTLETFRLKSLGSGNVKAAIYEDASGAPGSILNAVSESQAAHADWNDIVFPATTVSSGQWYWLAAIADSDIICYQSTTWGSKTKAETYSTFSFPQSPTGLTDMPTKQYLLAGHTVPPFIFIMSINCASDIKPGGTLYGSIAGDASVELYPHCTLTLTEVPDEGLDFPGMDSGNGEIGGTPATVVTYTIK